MTSVWANEKRIVAEAARRMSQIGLVVGTSGNISIRLEPLDGAREIFAITPAATRYETMNPDDIVIVDHDMDQIEGELPPSSESLLHVGIYQSRGDVRAVVHTHSEYSSVLAVAGLNLPPITDEVTIAVGGPVEVSDYAFPGTQDLADNVASALGNRAAAIIRNHGAVGVGRDIHEALDVCVLIERVAKIFIYASILGKANPLPPDVVEAEQAIYNMRRGF